jgi:alkanesulfonate monooxygenase SsuD/methylene tetrahydromethanopterin reductase-like flavin-dependent oxidoreductase (luciferase family)
MYEEALEVILAGLGSDALTHRGRHYNYFNVPIELQPAQQPHPPLWQGVGSPQAAAGAARRGANIVGTAPNATLKTLVDSYFSAWDGKAGNAAPLVGAQRHVYVADTDAEALTAARGAYKVWYDSLTSLWRKFGSAPIRFAESLDRALDTGVAIVGAPSTVRAEIERHQAESRCNYLVGRFIFGDLPYERARRSLDLFAREIMPHFQPRGGSHA